MSQAIIETRGFLSEKRFIFQSHRRALGMTQEQAAKALGISRIAYMRMYENSNVETKQSTLVRWCTTFSTELIITTAYDEYASGIDTFSTVASASSMATPPQGTHFATGIILRQVSTKGLRVATSGTMEAPQPNHYVVATWSNINYLCNDHVVCEMLRQVVKTHWETNKDPLRPTLQDAENFGGMTIGDARRMLKSAKPRNGSNGGYIAKLMRLMGIKIILMDGFRPVRLIQNITEDDVKYIRKLSVYPGLPETKFGDDEPGKNVRSQVEAARQASLDKKVVMAEHARKARMEKAQGEHL